MRGRRVSSKNVRLIERLESRQLLSAAQINYTSFSSTAGLVTNGFGSGATTSSNSLELTDGAPTEARSALYGTKVPIDTFTSHFSFAIAEGQSGFDGTAEADGLTFVIDNGSTSDVGADGSDLAYSAGTFGANSVAIELNTYNLGTFGSTIGFASGGVAPSTTQDASPVDFHSGDTIDATVTYDGTNLAITLVDASTNATTTASEAVNLAQTLGGHSAYVGFTGATGNDDSIQKVDTFDFTGAAAAPTISTVATSSPASPTSTKSHLSVTAVSNSGGTLSYAWSVLRKPPGATTPTFSTNSSSTSNVTTAHFFKAGTYHFRVTVTDSNGGSTVSDVSVVVVQTATAIKITPHKPHIVKGTTEQFSASVVDQFGHTFETEPTITYSVASGTGSVDDLTGLYTASGASGHLVIEASADDLSGVAGATVVS